MTNTATKEIDLELLAFTIKHYSFVAGIIKPSKAVESKIAKIANEYFKVNKKNITVTSGKRTTEKQAIAMYDKLAKGQKMTAIYRQYSAAKEVQDAYDKAVNAKKTVAQIKTDIKAALDKQVANKTYISDHMRDTAVDIRRKDMSSKEQVSFEIIAKKYATKVLKETKPVDHWHLEF